MSKLAFIVTLAGQISASAALAQAAVPDLRGTWKGESETIILGVGNPHHAGPPATAPRLNSVPFTLTIDKQDGRRFSGTFSSWAGAVTIWHRCDTPLPARFLDLPLRRPPAQ